MSDNTFQGLTKDFATDFGALRDDVARLTTMVGDLAVTHGGAAKAGVLTAVDKVRDNLDDVTDHFGDTTTAVSRRARAVGSEVGELVERNPLTALFLAVLGGVIIGMLSRSR